MTFECSEVCPGRNGLPKIMMRSSDGNASCEVYLFGATVTSWCVQGKEKMFVSETTPFDGKKAIRGGIPIAFPQFGRPDQSMPQHGFVRNAMWSLTSRMADENSAEVVFTITDSADTRAVWPHKFTLNYQVKLTSDDLQMVLEIVNTDEEPFKCNTLLHTYFSIPAVERLQVLGFHGMHYIDQLVGGSSTDNSSLEEREAATICEEVDRIYLPRDDSGAAASVEIRNVEGSSVETIAKVKHVGHCDGDQAEKEHMVSTDCVLWNAWIEKTRSIGDLPDDAYLKYVCVEPGLVSKPHTVYPGKKLYLTQQFTC